MAELILKNVRKVFDDEVVAVQNFNIKIEDKEFIVLVGPSGCGKSTTLRMIAGLDDITEGEVYIDGRLVNNVPPKDRDIAMVFQDYALYPHMTVYDNIGYGLKLRKYPKRVIDEKVKEAAKILDIEELLKRKPKALSGGQRQRVAIGRAIVRNPKVFLMDEPLSNLDAKLRNQMRAEILKLRQKIQTTFIYVTHDQTEAMTLGDRIVILKEGFVQQIGTPREVFYNPANIFVAGFIGVPQMNFFDAELIKTDKYYALVGDKKICLSEKRQAFLNEKNEIPQKITIGVRPEHMHITQSADGLKGVIDVVEVMGSSIYIHFKFNDKTATLLEKDKMLEEKKFNIGDDIGFEFKEEYIHIFDENGINIESAYEEEYVDVPEPDLSRDSKNLTNEEFSKKPDEDLPKAYTPVKKAGSFINRLIKKK